MSHDPPQRLTPKHHYLAHLLAVGRTHADAARLLGYSPGRVSAIAASPLFQTMLSQIQAEISNRVVTDAAAKITQLGARASQRLETLMEQEDNLSVSMAATAYVLDRNPDVAALKREGQDGGITIRLDGATMLRMDSAIAESEGRPALRNGDIPAVARPVPAELSVKTLQQAIDAFDEGSKDGA